MRCGPAAAPADGKRAIVIGSGMAGLAAALALARSCDDIFSEVLVVERRSEAETKGGAALTCVRAGRTHGDAGRSRGARPPRLPAPP